MNTLQEALGRPKSRCVRPDCRAVPSVWFRKVYPVNEDDLWAAATALDGHTEGTCVPSPEHNLVYLCVHLALHGLGVMRWLLDVDQYVRKRTVALGWDWGAFAGIAREWGACSAAFHAMRFSAWLFGTPIGGEHLRELDPGPAARRCVGALLRPRHLVAGSSRSIGQRYPTLVKLALADRFETIVRALWAVSIPSLEWRRHRYGEEIRLVHHWAHIAKVLRRGD